MFRELEKLGLTNALFLRVEEFTFLEHWERGRRSDLLRLYWEYLNRLKGLPSRDRKDYATLRRFEYLLQARTRGVEWEEAIEQALTAVPREPSAIEATALEQSIPREHSPTPERRVPSIYDRLGYD